MVFVCVVMLSEWIVVLCLGLSVFSLLLDVYYMCCLLNVMLCMLLMFGNGLYL